MLEIKGLCVYYGGAEALKDISLRVDDGEVVTLIGSNGAGKTTTLRTITGLKSPRAGEIWYDGENLTSRKPHQVIARGIAMVPEGRRIFPYMSVIANLLMGTHLRKDRQIDRDMESIYQRFPVLKERKSQLAGTLSGGEQQMLAIARALMSKPKLLLMDEPSLGLAPILVKQIGNIISEIHRDNISILLVEQNARMALGLSDRGYVLETGTIVMEGGAAELLKNELVKKAYLGA